MVRDRAGSDLSQRPRRLDRGVVATIRDGVAVGRAQRIATHMANAERLHVTANGDLHYQLMTSRRQVFIVPVAADGSVHDKPVPLDSASPFYQRTPTWAPDGGSLSYFVWRGLNMYDMGRVIAFVDMRSRSTRFLLPALNFFRMDVQSGQLTPVVRDSQRGNDSELGGFATWTRGSRAVAFTRLGRGLFEQDLASRTERAVVPTDTFVNGVAAEPGGERLAFSRVERDGKSSLLAVLDPAGAIHELQRIAGAIIAVRGWTTDGRVFYTVARPGGTQTLMSVVAAGGQPIDSGLVIDGAHVSVRPDGRMIAYSSGALAYEVWVMKGVGK